VKTCGGHKREGDGTLVRVLERRDELERERYRVEFQR